MFFRVATDEHERLILVEIEASSSFMAMASAPELKSPTILLVGRDLEPPRLVMLW